MNDESPACLACDSRSFHEWGRSGMYSVDRCLGCGMGITRPFPDHMRMESFNAEAYDVAKMVETYFSRKGYFERRYGGYVRDIRRLGGRGRLLDVGCNIGMFLKVARDAGFDASGVEINRKCAEFGRERFGLEIHSDQLENLRFPEGSFDVVTMFDVLEHVPDPIGFLGEANRILKSGGLLAVQSPNLDSLMAYLGREHWAWLSVPDHLFHFNPGSLARILESRGFRVERTTTWEPPLDFCTDLFQSGKTDGGGSGFIFKIVKGAIYVFIKATFVNRIWWKMNRGGLVLVYAVKSQAPPVRPPARA